jgi:hypothetical protein
MVTNANALDANKAPVATIKINIRALLKIDIMHLRVKRKSSSYKVNS